MTAKPSETALALILVTAPLLVACGSEELATGETSLVPNQEDHDDDYALRDLRLCLETMKEVDEIAHAAAHRGDFDRALKVWRGSARDGNVFSWGSLCIIHMSQSTPTRYRDYNEGFEACSSLALEDNATAQYALGRMYGAGLGVEKNETEALYWFKEAA
jgi:TPR repeat protein